MYCVKLLRCIEYIYNILFLYRLSQVGQHKDRSRCHGAVSVLRNILKRKTIDAETDEMILILETILEVCMVLESLYAIYNYCQRINMYFENDNKINSIS